MTDLIHSALDFIFGFLLGLIPDMSDVLDVISNADSVIGQVVDFISQVNFIVPLPTVAMIITIEVSIHVIAFTAWIGHKLVATVANVFF